MDFITEGNRIYLNDEKGQMIAEVTFPETSQGVCTIDHTFVDDSLRGRGVAGKLVEAAVDEIKKRGASVQATCSYAQGWLERH